MTRMRIVITFALLLFAAPHLQNAELWVRGFAAGARYYEPDR